jgi:MFS family permease
MSDLQNSPGRLAVGSRPARTWPWVAVLACAVVICGYVGNALAVLGPRLPGHFGISMESLGLLFGAPLLAAIIPYAIAGPASDRWGAKTTLLVALWGVAFSFTLCGA